MNDIYDLDVLKRGLEVVEANIKSIDEALAAQHEKKREYERHIAQAEAILAFHKAGSASVN